MSTASRARLFRQRDGEDSAKVTNIELFFDLVFVFAITQLSHRLYAHLSVWSMLETLVLFLGIWWAWINTCWVTNWLNPDRPLVRILLMVLMFLGLIVSGALTDAFSGAGFMLAGGYTAFQFLRTAFMLWALRGVNAENFANFQRIFVWMLASAIFWIIGAFYPVHLRLAFWAIAVVIEFIGPVVLFRTPGLGKSSTEDWDIAGGHVAERCSGFIIIALGEAMLVTGATLSNLNHDWATTTAFASAFLASAAMWWIYFDVGAKRGTDHIENADDPGKIALSAYTYFHMPIVAGIIISAVSDAMALSHPLDPAGFSYAAVTLGGPMLYITGTALFKRVTSKMDWLPISHLVGVGLLLLAVATVPFVSVLALSLMATATLIVVALWERAALQRHPELAEAEPAA
ncbi:low temperature requirement protein A [Sphingomonas sp.]|uniref:low temperature requirement protein A n=1 Tax=Sphingomonas sp. TaxID=28214 RepID=UPI0025E8B053|nr:low temperature requirement protein A [Sphingomonas sp.]